MDRRLFCKNISRAAVIALLPCSPMMKSFPSYQPIKRGDRIALISPGSPISRSQLDQALNNLKKLGLKAVYDDRVLLKYGYLAGTDRERVNQIHEALKDESIRAIWAIRGGYGCTRILPLIDQRLVCDHPKPVLGYSDITALLTYWDRISPSVAFHAPVLKEKWSSIQINQIKKVLFSNKVELKYSFSHVSGVNGLPVQGQMIGGNLSVLAAMCGTPWQWDIKDKIVFLEDIGEYPYRLDRMLNQLQQATPLHEAKAILLGQFKECNAPANKPSFSQEETFEKFFSDFDLPVISGINFGHISDQILLPINTSITLNNGIIKWNYL